MYSAYEAISQHWYAENMVPPFFAILKFCSIKHLFEIIFLIKERKSYQYLSKRLKISGALQPPPPPQRQYARRECWWKELKDLNLHEKSFAKVIIYFLSNFIYLKFYRINFGNIDQMQKKSIKELNLLTSFDLFPCFLLSINMFKLSFTTHLHIILAINSLCSH